MTRQNLGVKITGGIMSLGGQVSSSILLALLVTLVVLVYLPFHSVSAQQGTVNHRSLSTEKDNDESDLMVIEDIDEEEATAVEDIFVATKEWQMVKEGQSIPPGLHVRMNLQTGLKEAKLLDEADENGVDSKEVEPSTTDDITGNGEAASPESHSAGAKFTGDNRRTHYLGKSDRRGIVNKKTKVFTRKELMEALNKEEDKEETERMLLTAQELDNNDPNIRTTSHDISSSDSTPLSADGEPVIRRQAELPYILHEEVETMLDHSRTLAKKEASVAELVHALEELEYHVHNIDNAKDFDTIGGLVLVIRQLNHSSPEVRSHAAHVIGAASQSNPLLQQQVYDYGGLDHLCTLISHSQPDLVQRRSLYALSAMLRGNVQYQSIFLERCRGLEVLGGSFHNRGAQVQLKAVTLLTDIIHEQEEAEMTKGERKNILPILHDHILKHGWCRHVSSPIHSEEGTRIEKGLQAMNALQRTCDFSGQVGRLRRLMKQFERTLEQEQTDTHEYTELLLDYSRTLLRTIRQQNLDL